MRKTGTTDIPHVRITDHFIQRRPAAQRPTGAATTLVPARPLPATMHPEVTRGEAMVKAGLRRYPALHQKGVEILGRALGTHPGTGAAWATLGGGHLALGDSQAALAAFDKAMALAPQAVLPSEEHAFAAANAGYMDKAIETLRRATTLRADFAVGLGLLGNLLCRAGRCQEALPFLERAAAASPSDSTLAFNHAAALARVGRTEAAQSGFHRAMTLDPLNHQAAVEWAQLALAKGERKAAIEALSRASKCAPSAPTPRFVLARAYLAADALGEAAFQLDRYIALAPKDPNGYLERARVAHRARDRAGVEAHLAKGRAAVPGFPWDRVARDLGPSSNR